MAQEELTETTLALQHYYDVRSVQRRHFLGTLYDAVEQPFGRPVLLWVLDQLPEMGAAAESIERFEQAIVAGTHLRHAHHQRPLDFGTLSGGVPFLVMDGLEGRSLRGLISERGRLEPWEALRVLEQVADLVRSAHALGLSHLGLDAERIWVRDVGRMEVSVFGLGLAFTRSEVLAMSGIAVEVEMMRHLPPAAFGVAAAEVVGEGAEDGVAARMAADFYGVAAIYYECLSGRHPYFRDDRDVGDGVLAIMREEPPSLAQHFGFGEGLSGVVAQGLGRDPVASFEGVGAFVEAVRLQVGPEVLQAAAQAATPFGATQTVVQAAVVEEAAARVWSWRGVPVSWLVGAALAVVVALVLTWGMSSRTELLGAIAMPELIPQAGPGEGIDVVLVSEVAAYEGERGRPTRADLYVVNLKGEAMRVGQTPYVLRNQQEGARLHFVMSAPGVRPKQLALRVSDMGGRSMVVSEQLTLAERHTAQLVP